MGSTEIPLRLCDCCRTEGIFVICSTESLFLCMECDTKLHAANPTAPASHRRSWACLVCEQLPATVLCEADGAVLCDECDADIHSLLRPFATCHARRPINPVVQSSDAMSIASICARPTTGVTDARVETSLDGIGLGLDNLSLLGTLELGPATPIVTIPSEVVPISQPKGSNILGDIVGRKEKVLKYREKRKTLNFGKTIRYASRKEYAEARPRIKGRFAKQVANQVVPNLGREATP